MAVQRKLRRKGDSLVIRRYSLRIFLLSCLLATASIYLLLLNAQDTVINPSILRQELVASGQILEINNWTVQLLTCANQQPRGCIPVGSAVEMQLPGKEKLMDIIHRANPKPTMASISHHLTTAEHFWCSQHEVVSIIMPRMVHNYTVASSLLPDSPAIGFGANLSFPLQRNQLTLENPLVFEIDFTGFEWFGPADLPVVLSDPEAIAKYQSLSTLSLSSTFLAKQLDIGLPLIISGMALILDHSHVFPSLAVLAVIRAMRSWRAFDSEQASPFLNGWQTRALLFIVNVLAIPLLLLFITIVSDIILTRMQGLVLVGISCLAMMIYTQVSPSYEFESDLWIDLVGCILGLPLVLLGGYRQLNNNAKFVKGGLRVDWRHREARRIQIISRCGLLLFALLATGYANMLDLRSVSKIDFKQSLQWGHTVLIPLFVIVAMIDIGSITRKMRQFAHSMVERALIDRDLGVGKRIQNLLLPQKRGATASWQWRTFHYPSMTLAGDWFDVRRITTSNNRDYVLCCVVDVTGHGVGAALISTAISSHWSMWCQNHIGKNGPTNDKEREKIILEAPSCIHKSLMVLRENSGCTAAFLLLEERSGRMSYCTAGHPGIIAFSRQGDLKYLFTPGTRPGFSESQVGWTARSDHTEIGDLFFVYSDGVVPPHMSFSVWLKRLSLKARQDGPRMSRAFLCDMRRNKSEFRKNRQCEDDMSLVILERIA